MIYISNPQNTVYYGVYFNNGIWTQGGYEALAILSEIPTTAGNYNGSIVIKKTFSQSVSVFDVKFEPKIAGIFVKNLKTENNEIKINGKAYSPYVEKYKKIGWYK